MTKNEIREYIAGQKSSTGFPILEANSVKIVKRLKSTEPFQQALRIGAYAPLPDEVDITVIMTKPGRTFYIPAFDEDLGHYRLAKMGKSFKRGKFGILEPVDPVFAASDEIDLILVPGVAFDPQGNRLGRGGGFYDRLLPYYSATRIGVGFDFQRLENIATEPHDCKMHLLVTESNTLEFDPNH